MSRSIPVKEATDGSVRRRALGLGILASLLAFIGRSAARAADALTIDANGVAYFNGKRNYFKDEENKGWLRVGAHYSVPGIFSQDQAVVVGAEGKDIWLAGNARADKFVGKGAVPQGAILMWSGDPSKLPEGWALCDGKNGTPTLQDRFIVGYNPGNPAYNKVGNTGGEATHVLTIAEMPAHDHGSAGEHKHKIARTTHGWDIDGVQSGDPRNGGWRGDAETAMAGAHVHQAVGGGTPHENRPPYYVLAYIMYTG
jgi:microcystin-dependent protein